MSASSVFRPPTVGNLAASYLSLLTSSCHRLQVRNEKNGKLKNNFRSHGNRARDQFQCASTAEALAGGGWNDSGNVGNGNGNGGNGGHGNSGSGGSGGGSGGGSSGDPAGADGDEGRDESSGLWKKYCYLVEKYPFLTKGITAACLNAIADLFCQLVVERSASVDVSRLASFAAIGLFLVGPSLHIWYGLLPLLIPVAGDKGTVLRLAVDQIIFAPASLVLFFGIVLALEGKSDQILAKLKKDLAPTVLAQWKLWIPFQFVNFKFVPPSLQVATASALGLIWTVYMSLVAHSGPDETLGRAGNSAAVTGIPDLQSVTYGDPRVASS